MKKVVLLTGALAAGLAATSLNANASVPVAPNVQETNASDQQVAEMTYDKYHASVDVAIKWLYDLEVEFEAADIDADAKQEILKDIEKRSLELSGYTEDMENAWHNYEVDRENATNFAALQTALNDVAAKLESKEVVFPTETQIKTNLRDRYYHIAKDWKIYKDNVTRGNKLLAAYQDLMDDQYKQIDEIEDVKAAKKAVEEAHEKFRLDNKNFHADRWFEQNPKNWEPVSADHGTKPCCTDKEADLETLYQTLVGKKNDFDTLLNKYYTAKETLTSKLATSNQAETAALTADPATYTQSVDGKAWVKAAQQKVNDAQKAADDFIKTYNAADPAVWSNPASVDQLKGEDGKAPAFKKESEYERIANELITAVDNAINDLDAAVKEAKANEKAYQDGLKALEDRQNELDDIKTAYAGKDKEFTTGKVYEQVIKVEQDKINNAKTDLTTAWNTWTDKTLVPVDPKNAVEHVAGVTVDGVIYAQLKQDIADLLTKIQKNEAANDKIHEMTEALNGHYNELKNAVAGYEDVALSQYAADGLCAHGEYLGTTSLENLLNKFIEDEQKKYDAIQSDAYLADTTENGPTAKKDALDHELEMTWNAIATDQCAKYLAKVEDQYNTKHAYCEGLDDVCNEVEGEGAPCTCTEEDREANPCGWCDATARGMHDAIETAKSEMDGNIQDWHFATDAKNHVAEVKTYKDKAFTDIENWVNAFKDADRLHDKNLDDLKVAVDKAVHNVHELYADARHDLDNYKEADLAAANLWAQNKYGVDFKGYVKLLEELYETAQVAADDARAKHHFTELKAVGTECDKYATESDYRVAVQANKTAADANLVAIADLETRLATIVINDKAVYGDDWTTLDAEYQRIAGLIDDARAAAATAYNEGKAGEYIVPVEIASAITALQEAVKNAENVYAANVKAYDRLYAQLAAAVEARTALDTELSAVAGEIYAADQTVIDGLVAALPSVVTLRTKLTEELEAGTILAKEGDLADQIAALVNGVEGVRAVVAEKVAFKLKNVAAAQELTSLFQDLVDIVKTAAVGDVYASDATILEGKRTLVLDKIQVEIGYIAADLLIGKVVENRAQTMKGYQAMVDEVNGFQGQIKDAEKYLADSKAKAAAVSTAYNGLLDELKTLSYGDVYADEAAEIDERIATLKTQLQRELEFVAEDFENREVLDKDYTEPINNFTADVKGLNGFIKDCEKRLADNKAAKAELNAQLDAIQATVNGIVLNSETLYEDDYDTLFGKLDDLRALIGTVSGEIAAAFDGKVATEYQFPSTLATKLVELQGEKVTLENLYAANVAAREAKLREIADLEVALEAVVLDAKQVYNTENHSNLDQLLDMAADIQTKIDDARTGLYAAFDAKTAPDYNVPANEISTAIKELKLAVSDFQEFKRQNIEKATLVYNDLTNLLTEIEGLKKYGPVYEDEVEGGYDKTHIDRQIETLISSLNVELNLLKNDLEAGEVVANLEAYAQVYANALEEIENIKEGIADAEQLYAANYRALNNLEELIMAEKTVLENTKAMCACNECNTEDKAAVDALVGTLDTILGNVYDSFYETKDLAIQEGAFKGQVDLVKDDAANLLALIQLHLDKVQNDLRVYNSLQAKLAEVELELEAVKLVEGWENFEVRGAHADETAHAGATSNPNVKYLNELTNNVDALKALIEAQHSHEGGHSCEEYKLDDLKAMKEIVADVDALIAAIQANEAAHKVIMDRFNDLYADALDAYNFWHTYYTEYSTLTDDWYTANKVWVEEYSGELEPGEYLDMLKDMLHDSYVHGAAAYDWTKDAKGEELNDKANTTFAGYDADLAKDRNDLAHKEAINHYNAVRMYVDYEYGTLRGEYDNYDYWTDTWTKDPFTADVMDSFLDEIEGEFGIIASLNTFKADIEAAYAEGVMEDAINIDERNHALGIHQQLGGVKSVFNGILAEYKDLFEDAHHLTNGKKIFSDQEYFTLGFFKKANDGSVANGQEMFKEVEVLVNDDIRLYDSRSYVWNEMGTPDDQSDDEALLDEKGRVVYDKENNAGEIAEVSVLTVGQKSNELSFNFKQNPMAMERATLKAGTAEVDFLPGSIKVKNDNISEWVIKHTVSIDGIDVLAPEVAEIQPGLYASNGKLIVRVDNPIDLTYTINSLIARTDAGVEFSYADRELNYAAGQIEFTLPEGTQSVELPEGFFTFRTGENSIARSAACVVAVNNKTTSIDELVAMGEKAQIFDLQGRRVKAEALISGNTYVVNGEKKMVK